MWNKICFSEQSWLMLDLLVKSFPRNFKITWKVINHLRNGISNQISGFKAIHTNYMQPVW